MHVFQSRFNICEWSWQTKVWPRRGQRSRCLLTSSGGSSSRLLWSVGCPGQLVALVHEQQRWGVRMGSLGRWQQGNLAPDEHQQRPRKLLGGRVQKGGTPKVSQCIRDRRRSETMDRPWRTRFWGRTQKGGRHKMMSWWDDQRRFSNLDKWSAEDKIDMIFHREKV